MHHASKTNASANSARSVARQRHDTGLEREKMTVRHRLVKSRFSQRSSFTSTCACEGKPSTSAPLVDKQRVYGREVEHLLAARVVEVAHVRSLCADGRQSSLEVMKYAKRFAKLGSDVRNMRAECIFVCTAVVALVGNFLQPFP
jgi:hypothetical protein